MLFVAPCLTSAGEHGAENGRDEPHEHGKNVVGLFLGVTDEGREEAETLGIEYARHLTEAFGIALVAEFARGDLDYAVYAVPLVYHKGPWAFWVGPGVEDADEGSEYLTRVGFEYAFEVGAIEIAPQINVDFLDGEEVVVAGLLFAKRF
jgi:hypothetical protein